MTTLSFCIIMSAPQWLTEVAEMNPGKRVLIVGGGTAGWLTAAYLARTLGASAPGGVGITLVESPEIGAIGVGEGTFPSIRGTLAAIGVDEAAFLRESNATFKQGVKFAHWVRPPGTPGPDHYFHPFNLPSQRGGGPELLPYWLMGDAGGVPFAQAATVQKAVADASRAPKRAGDGPYQGTMNYAYHFDAAQFATVLARHARGLGVKHLAGTVERVELDHSGTIGAVHTREHGALQADLYIDCSGFRALLIGGALGAGWHGLEDVLFVDRALAVQVPYAREDAPIPSYTVSTAHEAGWTWDIGLQQRRGVGYVYSSRHTDDARAEAVLRRYIGPEHDALQPRQLKLKLGYRPTQWVRNCVAVGLSAGFLEPLESSGIGLIETAAYYIAHLFPFDGHTEPVARHFNGIMRGRFERIVDFLKLHYALSRRTDNAFWTDNADPASWTDTLREKLDMWRHRPPHRLDFIADLEMYLPPSWQFVLYGMEFETRLAGGTAAYPRSDDARREFAAIAQVAQHAAREFPDHRALIERLCGREAATA